MKILAIQCKSCLDIIYSRANHDFRRCSCGSIAIDAKGHKRVGDLEKINTLMLDGGVLLDLILYNDWNYKNRGAEEFPQGYHGRFEIDEYSNKSFFDKLVIEGGVIYEKKQ